jgi:hypothetical protein
MRAFWTIVIIVIAVVAIYLLISYSNQGGTYVSPSESAYPTESPSEYPSEGPTESPSGVSLNNPSESKSASTTLSAAETKVFNLQAQGSSGETGTATLNEKNGKTTVVLNVKNEPAGIEQPAHIHSGSCDNLGQVKYPLASPLNGKSTTAINATFAQLKSLLPLAINVHKSVDDIATSVSCADLSL